MLYVISVSSTILNYYDTLVDQSITVISQNQKMSSVMVEELPSEDAGVTKIETPVSPSPTTPASDATSSGGAASSTAAGGAGAPEGKPEDTKVDKTMLPPGFNIDELRKQIHEEEREERRKRRAARKKREAKKAEDAGGAGESKGDATVKDADAPLSSDEDEVETETDEDEAEGSDVEGEEGDAPLFDAEALSKATKEAMKREEEWNSREIDSTKAAKFFSLFMWRLFFFVGTKDKSDKELQSKVYDMVDKFIVVSKKSQGVGKKSPTPQELYLREFAIDDDEAKEDKKCFQTAYAKTAYAALRPIYMDVMACNHDVWKRISSELPHADDVLSEMLLDVRWETMREEEHSMIFEVIHTALIMGRIVAGEDAPSSSPMEQLIREMSSGKVTKERYAEIQGKFMSDVLSGGTEATNNLQKLLDTQGGFKNIIKKFRKSSKKQSKEERKAGRDKIMGYFKGFLDTIYPEESSTLTDDEDSEEDAGDEPKKKAKKTKKGKKKGKKGKKTKDDTEKSEEVEAAHGKEA